MADNPVVRVRWLDSWSSAAWEDLKGLGDEVHTVGDCSTVAFLLRKSANYLVLAGSINGAGQASGVICIPRRAVVEYDLLSGEAQEHNYE